MPRLIEFDEFRCELYGKGLSPSWYFPDAKFVLKGTSATYYWEFTIASGYASSLYIHYRHLGIDHRRTDRGLGEGAKLRVTIRRWIEGNLDGDVIHSVDDRTYTLPFPGIQVVHGYHVFRFETEQDANHFLLRFADLVQLPTAYDETDEFTQKYWQQYGQEKFSYVWR